jgi:hypothetical protein
MQFAADRSPPIVSRACYAAGMQSYRLRPFPFVCSTCGKTYRSWAGIIDHEWGHVPEAERERLRREAAATMDRILAPVHRSR